MAERHTAVHAAGALLTQAVFAQMDNEILSSLWCAASGVGRSAGSSRRYSRKPVGFAIVVSFLTREIDPSSYFLQKRPSPASFAGKSERAYTLFQLARRVDNLSGMTFDKAGENSRPFLSKPVRPRRSHGGSLVVLNHLAAVLRFHFHLFKDSNSTICLLQ